MRFIRILGIVISIVVAAASVWWIRNGNRNKQAEPQAEAVKHMSLVVAAEPLRYGQRITASQVKLIDWLGKSLPAGAFETIEALGINDEGPYSLAAMAEGTPIFQSQITAPGQKPSLSARLELNEVAVTIPVNTITGVAGFVLPEERVDVIINRRNGQRIFADVILQNVRVLAVNSIPDASNGEPVQAKSVTFATSREAAQKLEVASGMGELSLVLRSPMSEDHSAHRSISDLDVLPDTMSTATAAATAEDLTREAIPASEPEPNGEGNKPEFAAVPPPPTSQTEVTVIRGVERSVVTLP